MLRGREGDGNTGVGDGEGVVAVSAGHEYVGSTRGLGIVSSTADVLWMSVESGMKGGGVVCEMCMCLARGNVWIRGLGLGLTNPVETRGVLDVCQCLGCGGVCGECYSSTTCRLCHLEPIWVFSFLDSRNLGLK